MVGGGNKCCPAGEKYYCQNDENDVDVDVDVMVTMVTFWKT